MPARLRTLFYLPVAMGLCMTTVGQAEAPGDWPQWRGPHRDGRSLETGLLQSWPAGGPKLLWTHRDAGVGYGGPSVVGSRLYCLGTRGHDEIAFALDLETGSRLWTTPISKRYANPWGDGPRSTPTVDGDRLYVLSGTGVLACLDSDSGSIVWKKSLVDDFGSPGPERGKWWGFSESPLVDGNKVVVTPGGEKCFVALDKRNGDLIWTSRGIDDEPHYASLVPFEAAGVKQYATQTGRGLVGIAAETGELLWRFEKTANPTAVIPTPVVAGSIVYATSDYGSGCGAVRIEKDGSGIKATPLYHNRDMQNHHGGVVLVDGRIFGYSRNVAWVAQELETGKLLWRERRGFKSGSVLYADGRLYCYGEDDGVVVLVEPSAEGWKEHGRFSIPEQTKQRSPRGKIWTHPILAHGKLILRDQELMFCFDVRS